jgi:hypothetical protein
MPLGGGCLRLQALHLWWAATSPSKQKPTRRVSKTTAEREIFMLNVQFTVVKDVLVGFKIFVSGQKAHRRYQINISKRIVE